MQRSKNIPDAINVSHLPNYTPIPNDLIRDPNISGKAKAILCLLLSNSNGWTSHVQAIEKMMKEGKDAIYSGLQELEIFGYFMRVKYRNKVSKKIIGNLWCYTNKKNNFDYIKIREYLEQQGCEPQRDFPDTAFPDTAFPDGENPPLRKQIIKKTNNKENNTCKHVEDEDKNEISFGVEFSKKETQPKNDKITIRQFDLFWKIYPKKTDKGKALSKWAEICNRKDKNRIPTWKEIKRAIYAQKKTPRWQKVDKDGKALYIPLPTTWLNKSRWLDDPAEMVTFDFQNNNTNARANGYTDDGLANALQNVKTNIHK